MISPAHNMPSPSSGQSAKETSLVPPPSNSEPQVNYPLPSDQPAIVDTLFSSNHSLTNEPAATVISAPDDKSSPNDESSQYDPATSDIVLVEGTPRYIIGSQTLNAGTMAAISGLEVSLPVGSLSIVVEGKTIALNTFAHSLNMGASIISSRETHPVSGAAEGTSLVVGSRTLPMSSLLGQITGFPNVVIGTNEMPLESFLAGVSGDPKVVMGGTTMPLSEFHGAATGDANVVIGTRTVALSKFLQDMDPVGLKSGVGIHHDRTESSGTFTGTATSLGLGGMIASLGGFEAPPPLSSGAQTTPSSRGDGNVSFNGAIFLGGSSHSLIASSRMCYLVFSALAGGVLLIIVA
jgi:hypothetical protein